MVRFCILFNVGQKGDEAKGCWHTRPLCHGEVAEKIFVENVYYIKWAKRREHYGKRKN